MPLTIPVPEGRPTFALAPRGDLAMLEADIAVLGVPHGVPYDMDNLRAPSATAPAAVREQSIRFGHWLDHYDVDFGGRTGIARRHLDGRRHDLRVLRDR